MELLTKAGWITRLKVRHNYHASCKLNSAIVTQLPDGESTLYITDKARWPPGPEEERLFAQIAGTLSQHDTASEEEREMDEEEMDEEEMDEGEFVRAEEDRVDRSTKPSIFGLHSRSQVHITIYTHVHHKPLWNSNPVST